MTTYHKSLSFPLGVMYLASSLRRKGHEVRILDLRLGNGDLSLLRDNLKDFHPEVVGLSSITVEAPSLHASAEIVKSFSPQPYVIAGGPHPTSFPHEVLADPHIDCVVPGEGEHVLADLLSHGMPVSPDHVKGLCYRNNGDVVHTASPSIIEDLDSIPFPAWDLVEIGRYFHNPGMGGLGRRRYMTIFTSRGCPYRCIYCHNIFGKAFRARSPESVVEEISLLYKVYGIRHFEAVDDIFNMDKNRAHAICNLLKTRNLSVTFSFPNGLRTDILDHDLLDNMKDAGLESLSIAVESASPRIQKLIKKNINLDRIMQAIEWCDRLKIFTRGFFMLGFPTETREEMHHTIRYARISRLHWALFFIVIPFKGTELYNNFRKYITKEYNDPTTYDYMDSYINMSMVPDRELQSLIGHAYRTFYLTPRRISRLFMMIPKKSIFFQHLSGAMKFLFYKGRMD